MHKTLNKRKLAKKGIETKKQIDVYIGIQWKNLPDVDKEKYNRLAERDRDRYEEEVKAMNKGKHFMPIELDSSSD